MSIAEEPFAVSEKETIPVDCPKCHERIRVVIPTGMMLVPKGGHSKTPPPSKAGKGKPKPTKPSEGPLAKLSRGETTIDQLMTDQNGEDQSKERSGIPASVEQVR